MHRQFRETCKIDTLDNKRKLFFLLISAIGLGVSLMFSFAGPDVSRVIDPTRNSGKDIDIKTKKWEHTFHFVNNLYSNHFGLSFSITPNKTYFGDIRHEVYDLPLAISWTGIRTDGSEEVFSDEVTRRYVTCSQPTPGDIKCTDVLVFWDSYVTYEKYRIRIQVDPKNADRANFIESVSFAFTYENLKFAIWQIRLKYLCVGLTVIALAFWYYVCKIDQIRHVSNQQGTDIQSEKYSCLRKLCCCCGPKACPYRTGHQRWILALLISLLMYNDPLYGTQYLNSAGWREFFSIVSTMMQLGFLCILLVFWIVSFETLYKSPPFGRLFYLPKFLFAFSLWLVGTILYGKILHTKNSNRLYDWYEDDELTRPVIIVLAVYGGIYLVWLMFVMVRGMGQLFSLNGAGKLSIFVHLWRIIIVVLGVALGATFPEDPRHDRVVFFFQFVLNLYVFELVYLYSPVYTTPVMFDENTGGLGAVNQEGVRVQITGTSVSPKSKNHNGQSFGFDKAAGPTTTVELGLV